jgi:hypothetical protein
VIVAESAGISNHQWEETTQQAPGGVCGAAHQFTY